MELNKLTEEEKRVIIDKGTEASFSGEYVNNKKTGVYVCRQCSAPLYNSKDYHQDYLQKNPGGYTCHAVYFDSYLK